jgi:nucleoside-diphosphate-sugar epimerase
VDDAARVILSVLKQLDCKAPLWGTYHYAGNEATTPLALGQAILGEAGSSQLAVQQPPPRPMPRARMPAKSRSMRYWPARKSFTPSASSRAPGAPACRLYWTVSTAMADAPILITGGAGFIGSHLCDALLDKGYAVRILDDLSTGKRSNLQVDHPRLELIEGDVADAALVARAAAGCQCRGAPGGGGLGAGVGRGPGKNPPEQFHRHAQRL